MDHNLPEMSRRTARALIEVAKPRKPDFDLPIEDSMLDFLDNFVKYFPLHMKILFPLGLFLLEYGTFIFMGRLKTFSRLSLEERDRYVQSWVDSNIPIRRDLIKGVKGLCVSAFYSDPQVMDHIGYEIEAHLGRVNGLEGPPQPANPEACAYFEKMREKGIWGFGNYSGAFIREELRPTPARKPKKRETSKPEKPELKKPKAVKKTRRAKK
jgi:hypothetical protein